MRTVDKEKQYLEHIKQIMHNFTLENYGVPLTIPVNWSGRLTVSWGLFKVKKMRKDGYYSNKYYKRGQYIPETMNIVLSRRLLQAKNKDMVVQIAKHEAIHYVLCVLGKPFNDGDRVFEMELRKHNLVSNTKRYDAIGVSSRVYVWTCSKCNKIVKAGGKTRKDYSKGYETLCCKGIMVDKGWQEIKEGQKYVK